MSRKNNQLLRNTQRFPETIGFKNKNQLINTTNTYKYQQPKKTIKKLSEKTFTLSTKILNKKRAEMTHTPEPTTTSVYQQSDSQVNTNLQEIFSQQQQYQSNVITLFQNNSQLYNETLMMIENIMSLLKQIGNKSFVLNNFISEILQTCYTHAFMLYKQEPIKLSKTMKNKVNNIGNIMNNTASASDVSKMYKYNHPKPYVRNKTDTHPLLEKLNDLNIYYDKLCSSVNVDCSQHNAGTITLINPYNIRLQSFYPHIKSESMLRQFIAEDMNSIFLHLQQNNVLLNNISAYLNIIIKYFTQAISELKQTRPYSDI